MAALTAASALMACGGSSPAAQTTAAQTTVTAAAESSAAETKAPESTAAETSKAAGSQEASGNAGGEDGVFTIAYAPNESTAESADARKGLSKDLSAALGCDVEEINATDYNAIIEALRTGKAEMGYMGSQALALGVERTNLEPIVMKAPDGDREQAVYHSVLITQSSNSEINSIQDIKGKSMAFVDPDSTSGNLVPTAEIIKAFPDENLDSDKLHTNGEFFEAVSFSGSHQAGLQAVIKGDVDVVPISDQIMKSEIDHGNAKETDVKVIHTSGAIPAECMAVAESVDQATRDKLISFLTNYSNADYFRDVIKVPNAKFIPCSLDDYKDIIELNKIING